MSALAIDDLAGRGAGVPSVSEHANAVDPNIAHTYRELVRIFKSGAIADRGRIENHHIGATTLIDALLDERASRKNVSVRVISSGCKMDEAEAEAAAKIAAQVPTDLYVAVSPSAGLPGPKKMREVLKETGKPIIVVSDEPSRKAARKLPEEGIGYLVLYGDAMIGAKID